MKEKGLDKARIHTITSKVKLEEKMVEELKRYGIERIDSTTINFFTGEVVLEVYTIIWGD